MAVDLYGREVGEMPTGATAQALGGPVKTVMETKAPGTEAALNRLYDAVNALAMKKDQGARGEAGQAKDWALTVIDFIKNFKQGGGKGGKESGSSDIEVKYLAKMADASSKLWNASQKQNTIWFGLAKLSSRAQKQIADAIKLSGCCGAAAKSQASAAMAAAQQAKGGNVKLALASAMGGKGGGGGGGGGGRGGAAPPADPSGGGGAAAAGMGKAAVALAAAKAVLDKLVAAHKMIVAAVDLDPFKHIFTGALSGSNAFRENMRAILHQTVGFGNENRAIEQSFLNIEQNVRATGVRAEQFAQTWTQNVQRGLSYATENDQRWARQFNVEERAARLRQRQAGRLMSVTTSALSTAQALGMEAGFVNDLFMDWHMHLGMSSMEMAEIGRGMQEVARNTGITGKQLEKAMQSADRVMRSMKSAGGLTVEAAKNVQEISALMQRHGVSEQGGQMMQALSSRHAFFNQASPEMRSMLSRIGMAGGPRMMSAVREGTVFSNRDNTRAFGQSMERELGSFLRNFQGDFARMGVAMPTDMTQLSRTIEQLRARGPEGERIAGVLDQQMRNRFAGMGVGDMEQMMRVFREQGMSSGERIADITRQMNEMAAQGRTGLEEYRRLQRTLLEQQVNQNMSAFTTLNSTLQANGARSWADASESVRNTIRQQLTRDMGAEAANNFLNNLDQSAGNLLQQLQQRAQANGQDLSAMLRSRGSSLEEVQSKLAQGGVAAEEAMETLNAAQQELQRRERASQDPVTNIRDILTDWNTKLFGHFTRIGAAIGNVAAQILYIGGFIISILGEALIALGMLRFLGTMSSTLSSLGGMLGMGGTGGGGLLAGLGGISASTAAATAGAIIGPLLLAIGGVKGALEAEAAGRTTGEGILLGALTGGAGTGSFVSDWVGVERGSDADKAIGVGMAATWAAAIGAAIGTFVFPGVGTAIGAAIGAVVGAAFEILKILTEGTNFIQRYIIRPIEGIVVGLWKVLGGLWDIIAGIFTLDGDRIMGGIKKIIEGVFHAIMEVVRWFWDSVISLLLNIPNLLLGAIRAVFLDLPRWIFNKITEGLQALANNEYVGAIFGPILELWNAIKNIFDQIYDAVVPVIDALRDAWNGVKEAIWGVIGPLFEAGGEGSFLAGVFSFLGDTIKVLSSIIGWVLKVALWPVIKVFQGIGIVVGWIIEGVRAAWNFLKPVFQWLWNTLKTIGEIVYYVVAIALWPFIKVVQGIIWVVGQVIDIIGTFVGYIIEGFQAVWEFCEPVLTPLWEGIQAIGRGLLWFLDVVLTPFRLAWEGVCAVFEVVGNVVSSIVNGIKSAFQWLYDVLYGHSIVPDLIQGIISLFARLPLVILQGLANLGLSILQTIGNFLLDIPGMLLGAIDSLLGGIPGRILGMLNNLLGGVPGRIVSFVWDGLRSVFGGLIDFLRGAIGGLIQGIGNIISGFRETNEQAEARIAESGPSVTHGIGRTAGGLWDTITGGSEGFFSLSGRWEGLKKTFGGAWETIRGVGSAIWSGARGIWNGVTSVFGSITSTVGGWLSSAGSFLGSCWESVTGFFGGIGDTVGGWLSNAGSFLGDCFSAVGDFFGGITSTVGGWLSNAGSFLGSCFSAVGDFFGGITSTVGGWLSSAGSFLGDCFSAVGNFFGGIGDTVGGWLSSAGSFLGDCFSAVGDFFGGIGETVSGWIGGAGEFLGSCWDSVTGFIGGIGDWFSDAAGNVGGWISDGFNAVTGFVSDLAGGITGFLGDVAGGIGDFFSDPVGTIGGLVEGAGNVLSDVGSSIGGAISSVGSAIAESPLNPLNWFQEGTREIEQGGLAVLHEGEMVIPKDVWEQIKAIGAGSFGGGGGIMDSFSNIFGGIGDLFGLGGGGAEATGGSWLSSLTGGLFGGSTDTGTTQSTGGSWWDTLTGGLFNTGGTSTGGTGGWLGGITDTIGSWFGGSTQESTTAQSTGGGSWWDKALGWLGLKKQETPAAVQDKTQLATQQLAMQEVYDPYVAELLTTMLDEITSDEPVDMTMTLEGAFAEDQPMDAIDADINTHLKELSTDLTDRQPTMWEKLFGDVFGGWGDPLLDWMGINTAVAEEAADEQGTWFERMSRDFATVNDTMAGGFEYEPLANALSDTGDMVLESTMDAAQSALEGASEIAESTAEGFELQEPEGILVFDPTIAEILADIFEGVEEMPVADDVSTALLGAFESKAGVEATDTAFQSEQTKMFSYWDYLSSAISNPIGTLQDSFKSLSSGTWLDSLTDSFGSMFGGGSSNSWFEEYLQPFKWAGEASGATDWFSSIGDSISSWFGGSSSSGGSGSWLSNIFGGSSIMGSLGDSLSSYTSSFTSGIGSVMGGLGFGLFDRQNVGDATDVAQYQKQQYYNATFAPQAQVPVASQQPPAPPAGRPSIRDRIRNAYSRYSRSDRASYVSQSDQGLFNSETNITEAMGAGVADRVSEMICTGINNCISSALETKRETQTENIVAQISDAMNYEQSASDAANSTRESEFGWMSETMGDLSPNPMDYTDDLRGEVATLGLSRAGLEERIERDRYGETTTGSNVLPSMDAIADYLITVQSDKLDQIIMLLGGIKDNTEQRGFLSSIIGKMSEGLPPTARPGIKNIARDNTRGFWDLTYGDESPGAVTTEGRGGSA